MIVSFLVFCNCLFVDFVEEGSHKMLDVAGILRFSVGFLGAWLFGRVQFRCHLFTLHSLYFVVLAFDHLITPTALTWN